MKRKLKITVDYNNKTKKVKACEIPLNHLFKYTGAGETCFGIRAYDYVVFLMDGHFNVAPICNCHEIEYEDLGIITLNCNVNS